MKQHQHKNVFLRMSVAKYIANDFKHIYGKDAPSLTAAYIEQLDKHITARPLGYITALVLRHVNDILREHGLAIDFDNDKQQLTIKPTRKTKQKIFSTI